MISNSQFKKWCDWLNTIRDDVQTLYFYRYIFQGVVDIVSENEQLDIQSPFFGFFERIYGDSVVMGIRRQLKVHADSISLARLLTEVAARSELVTRSDFFEVFKDYGSPRINQIRRETFDRFALPGSPHIDPARIEADLPTTETTVRSGGRLCRPSHCSLGQTTTWLQPYFRRHYQSH